VRKGRIKYYFKNKNAVINDVGKLCDMNEQLEQELERYKNIINTVRNCILTDISMLKTRRPEMSKEEIIMRLEATVKSLDKLQKLKGSDE
jgi:DNA integrity scanning protein DisA with diadenylate cyclase activity